MSDRALQPPRWVRRVLVGSVVALVLCSVFALYSRPALLVRLADQLWSCF